MLKKRACQYLTSGKSDEEVSDGGGPRSGHSIFTGHLLDILESDDVTMKQDDIKTASTVSSYVFTSVGAGFQSIQIPHWGHIYGEGDFIFNPPKTVESNEGVIEHKTNSDVKEGDVTEKPLLVSLPSELNASPLNSEEASDKELKFVLEDILQVKENKILLDRFTNVHIQEFIRCMNVDRYPNSQSEISTNEKIAERISRYEVDSEDLQKISMVLSKWGHDDELKELKKLLSKVAETDKDSSGLTFLINLQWYPLMLLVYAVVIAGIASENLPALRVLLGTKVRSLDENKEVSIVVLAFSHIAAIQDWFKNISGNERHYVPRSEYLFQFFQPMAENILFLGNNYEQYFNEAEIFIALAFINETRDSWGPIGRFGYKNKGYYNPYAQVMDKLDEKNSFWSSIAKELFNEKSDEFRQLCQKYTERLNSLSWY